MMKAKYSKFYGNIYSYYDKKYIYLYSINMGRVMKNKYTLNALI